MSEKQFNANAEEYVPLSLQQHIPVYDGTGDKDFDEIDQFIDKEFNNREYELLQEMEELDSQPGEMPDMSDKSNKMPPCRYGENCYSSYCKFSHPPRKIRGASVVPHKKNN